MKKKIAKIISGGQSSIDRAALDSVRMAWRKYLMLLLDF
jgi:hypothetical protein